MNLKVFALDPETQAFDDAELQAFQAEHEVVGLDEHFFEHHGTPMWVVLVDYKPRRAGAGGSETQRPDFKRDRKGRIELPPKTGALRGDASMASRAG